MYVYVYGRYTHTHTFAQKICTCTPRHRVAACILKRHTRARAPDIYL